MSLIESMHYGYQSVDIDLGEMFNNFNIHVALQPFSGIDLTQFRGLLEQHYPEQRPFQKRILYKWSRACMGLKPSPYWSARYYYLMEEFMMGDHRSRIMLSDGMTSSLISPAIPHSIPPYRLCSNGIPQPNSLLPPSGHMWTISALWQQIESSLGRQLVRLPLASNTWALRTPHASVA